jgi:hypothetical protein
LATPNLTVKRGEPIAVSRQDRDSPVLFAPQHQSFAFSFKESGVDIADSLLRCSVGFARTNTQAPAARR